MLYAIARIQGKQYKLIEGNELTVDRLQAKAGDAFGIDEVLLVSQDDAQIIGAEAKKAKIKAVVVEELKDKKVSVLKYKKRKRYRKLTGHRQILTKIKIESIDFSGKKAEKAVDSRQLMVDKKANKEEKQKTESNKKVKAKPITESKAQSAEKPASKKAIAEKRAVIKDKK